MTTEMKKRSLALRVQLFDHIATALGMSMSALLKCMAPYFSPPGIEGKKVDNALHNQRTRGYLPDKPKYSYENFCSALEKGIADYLNKPPKGEATAKTLETVRRRWETEHGFIQLLIEAAYLVPGEELPFITQLRAEYEPTKEKLLSTFEARFMELDPRTAARLEYNFEAFARLSINDCRFVLAMQVRKGEDRVELGKQLRGITLPVGVIWEQLDPEELVCWKAIRDKADKGKGRLLIGESWIAFRDRLKAIPLERALSVCLFLEYTLPRQDGTEPFSPEEIDLFLMFKYCLTEETQEKVLKMWNKESGG